MRDPWSLFQTLPADWDLQQHATLRHISPSSFPCSLAFRATIHSRFMTFRVIMSHFQFGVQSHFSNFASSEPPSFLSFNVQSHHFSVSAFRAIITSLFGVQSHRYHFLVLTFKAIITSSFGVQSHCYHFLVSVFKAILIAFSVSTFTAIIITFQFRRSKPSLVFSLTFKFAFLNLTFKVAFLSLTFRLAFSVFGVQSYHHFLVSAFRTIIVFSVWHSKLSSSLPSFSIQSHHCHFSVSAFKAIIVAFQFRHSEPSSV